MRLVEFFYQELRGSCEMGGSITEGQELDFFNQQAKHLKEGWGPNNSRQW